MTGSGLFVEGIGRVCIDREISLELRS